MISNHSDQISTVTIAIHSNKEYRDKRLRVFEQKKHKNSRQKKIQFSKLRLLLYQTFMIHNKIFWIEYIDIFRHLDVHSPN